MLVGAEVLGTSSKAIEYESFEVTGTKYSVGDSVYLPPETHKFPVKGSKTVTSKLLLRSFPDGSDEATYPELYRKSEYIKGSNSDVPKPFQIGKWHITLIWFNTNCTTIL